MGNQTTGATPEQKLIVASIRDAIRTELKAMVPGCTRVIYLDCHYVGDNRNVRPTAEGKEPLPLKYAGNPYATIDLMGATAVVEGKHQPISSKQLGEAWDKVLSKHFKGDTFIKDGTAYKVLDPALNSKGAVEVGFTGISFPAV